jgi:hypothetical protein
MAIKPFEIQSSTITIGGVDLAAGTTGIVIPGVTQATNYRVEEVEDTDVEQTVQFVQLTIVVDAATYNALSTSASTAAYATYSVELDDDLYIDNIEVSSTGSYTQQEKTTNETTDMWAYTGLVDPFATLFDEADWLQVPFRPKMRADEVENVGGGSGDAIVDGNNSLTIDGSGNAVFQGGDGGEGVDRGLVWDYGDYYDGINSTVRQDNDGLSIRAWTQGDGGGPTGEGEDAYSASVNIRTNAGDNQKWWRFAGDGSLTFPDGTVQTTAYNGVTSLDPYKGFKVMYGRMYNSEPTISKLVIYQDTATSVSSTIDEDTSSDLFRVTGLANSGIIAMINVYGSDSVDPVALNTLKTFAEAIIDNVILDQGVEGNFNSADTMRQAFYDNYSNFGDLAGSKYVDFKFSKQLWTGLQGTTQEGSGATFDIIANLGDPGVYHINGFTGGSNYRAGHKIRILGTSLGGTTPANDLFINVDSVVDDVDGVISIASIVTGTADGGAQTTYNGVSGTNYQVGSGAIFTLFRNDTDGIPQWDQWTQQGTNYVVGDVITVLGTDVDGLAPTNNITVTITGVEPGGLINGSVTLSGTLPTDVNPDYSIYDGGNDQYDTANYIFTDLQGDSRASSTPGVEDDDWAVPYNVDTVSDGDAFFGAGSEYTVVYNNSIFGLFVTGAEISWIGTNGNSGFDGDGQADTGSLYESNIGLANLSFAVETTVSWEDGDLVGPTLRLGTDATQQVIITGPAATSGNTSAQRLVIQGQQGYGGEGNTKGEGGDVYIWAGSGGDAGSIDPRGDGGDVKLRGGQGGNYGGYIRIESGEALATNGTSGQIEINAANAPVTGGEGGYVQIRAGDGQDDGGGIFISAGGGTAGDGGDIILTAGAGGTNNGEVRIVTHNGLTEYTWVFKNDGSLELPSGSLNAELTGDGDVASTGYFYTFNTDFYDTQTGGANSLTGVILSSSFVGDINTGDTITFRNGETRVINLKTTDGMDAGATLLEWSGDTVSSDIDNPAFPITIQSSDYVPATKKTARIKPDSDYVSLNQYMEIYTGGGPSTVDDLGHIHMKGHTGNVELFLGTDDNFVSTKEAGTTPGHVTMRSETEIKVIETAIRTTRNGSTFVSTYGDGFNYNWNRSNDSDISHSCVAVDGEGNYYIGGEWASESDAMISKFSKDGELLWSKFVEADSRDVTAIAYNPDLDQVALACSTLGARSYDHFKLVTFDSDGNLVGDMADFFDTDGSTHTYNMKYNSTLGWVIAGRTNGDEVVNTGLTPQTGSGVAKLVLNSEATRIRGTLMNYGDSDWKITGDNITGKQTLGNAIGLFKNLSVVNVSVTNPAAAGGVVSVRIDYNGAVYYGIDAVTTPGTDYTTGDTVKVLGSQLGGVDGTNDVTFTLVDNGTGGIQGSSNASGTPSVTNITLDLTEVGFTTENFSTGTYNVIRQVQGRPFVWTSSWDKFLDIEDGYNYGYASSVFVDSSNNVFVGGYVNGSTNSGAGSGFVWKLNSSGVTQWVKGLTPWEVNSIVCDSNGAIYVLLQGMGIDLFRLDSLGDVMTYKFLDAIGAGRTHLDIARDEQGDEHLYVGFSDFGSIVSSATGFAVQKLSLGLEPVWSRLMELSNGSNMGVDYDTNYQHFALTPTQAAIVGYGGSLGGTNADGQLCAISITDDFVADPAGVSGIRTRVIDLHWGSDPFTADNLITVGLEPFPSTIQTDDNNTLSWISHRFQSRIINGNAELKGLVGVDNINFINGDNLDHNPVDIPQSLQNLQVDDPLNWNITLTPGDRGKFIKNQHAPGIGNCQNLTVYVPGADEAFPVGSIITLLNLDTSSTYSIHVQPVGYISSGSAARIYATGYANYSIWSFGGMQTATLMKISPDDWLLTANDIINED